MPLSHIVCGGKILLTRELRKDESLLNLPGGKFEAGETFGDTAAREAYQETGGQLSKRTCSAIAAIAVWAECKAASMHVGVLQLDPDDPDATVHERFDSAKANRPGSSTVQEGLEWHPLASVRDNNWRQANMHIFPGAQLARTAITALSGPAGPSSMQS